MERSKRATNPEELLVVQSLKIVDRYGKREKQLPQLPGNVGNDFQSVEENLPEDITNTVYETDCLDKSSMITGAIIFLAAQLIIVIMFALMEEESEEQRQGSQYDGVSHRKRGV